MSGAKRLHHGPRTKRRTGYTEYAGGRWLVSNGYPMGQEGKRRTVAAVGNVSCVQISHCVSPTLHKLNGRGAVLSKAGVLLGDDSQLTGHAV